MKRLQEQLDNNLKHQEEMQQQAQQAQTKVVGSEAPADKKEKAQFNLEKAKQEYQIASTQIQQLNMLKQRMVKLYQLQGFKNMIRSNPNMS